MIKKPLLYLLAATENIIFAAGNVALALNKYMPEKEYEILILHRGLSKNNEEALLKIPKVRLQYYDFPEGFEEHMLSPRTGLPRGRWNNPNCLVTAAHFEIFGYLDIYKTVIWIDVDMSIQAEINELEKYGPIAQALDLNYNQIWTVRDQFTKYLLDFDMSGNGYINSVIVVNDQLENYSIYKDECYKLARKYAPYLKNLDQAVFALLFQKYSIIPEVLPWNEYTCHAHHEAAAIAKIVHFGCTDKVWNNSLLFQCYPEWFRVHMEWLKLGGCDFDRSSISSKAIWSELNTLSQSFGETNNKFSSIPNKIAVLYKKLEKNPSVAYLANKKLINKNGEDYTLRDLLKAIYKKIT